MATRDHEPDDLTLHDLIEGPTQDLTSARAALAARATPPPPTEETQDLSTAQTAALTPPRSDDHEVDSTSGDPQDRQLHDRRSGEPGGRKRVELERVPAAGGLYRRAMLGALPGVGRRRGRELPGVELGVTGVRVEPGHLADYDRVCGFRLADRLPATYLHVLGFPLSLRLMTAADFPIPLTGVVHVANRITVRRPVRADEVVDFRTYAENLRPHERGRQLDVVLVGSVGGEEVWRGVSTYLGKERAAGGGPRRDRGDRPAPPAPSARWRVTPRVGSDYARVSGDHNPIHTSKLGARLFGFPRPIAHGMWSKARCLAALDARLPDVYTVDVAFKLPVPLPSTVAFSASRSGEGWDFGLHGARDGRPHLVGTVR
ncbi:MaoC/PaaZ C-terminal domain-containing protein [Micromonospora sp. WMMD975]|uniref:MaoC/PaaZ C-terminal domain-containing protein n=1 Tax=Micromonospora sp. WMMD975 TaxID=3016087 RepID=UPI00249CD457|nr:MaoC/PaaZ C-terminal domain-containing protein [Micromonospora sp. WMMD975]WFE33084.1 MaoC/PaaZ C-terminal domain-containing protein [Micromonospora sp. WMMD975]